jgi:hypothetical protein
LNEEFAMQQPRVPTFQEIVDISCAMTGAPDAFDHTCYLVAVFDLDHGEKAALVSDWPDGRYAYVLSFDPQDNHWVIQSIAWPTQVP